MSETVGDSRPGMCIYITRKVNLAREDASQFVVEFPRKWLIHPSEDELLKEVRQ